MPKTQRPPRKPRLTIAPEDRVVIASLRGYLNAITRAAGKGQRDLERKRFAERCGTSDNYLVQLAMGVRRARAATALAIEQASYGVVRAEDVCPEFDWHYAKVRGLKPKDRAVALNQPIPATPHAPLEREDHHVDITA
jgi:DNA-binding transcriptional regulator YdaS (Cro superfamily)